MITASCSIFWVGDARNIIPRHAFASLRVPLRRLMETNVSEEPGAKNSHGSNIHTSKGGGGSKLLIGAAAAVILAGAAFAAWQNFAPGQSKTETAYNEPYAQEPLRAGPIDPDQD